MRRIIIALIIAITTITISHTLTLECDCDGITIASWNVQNLGPTKLEDGRAERIASHIEDHDIIVIQEITDASGRAGAYLCESLPNHACTVSERTGGTRKEQYLIASRYPIASPRLLEHEELERGVYLADIDLGYRTITIATAHLKPDRVPSELRILEEILPQNVILAGDLNSDCRYLPEGTRDYLTRTRWIIPDSADTTPARSRCAYDRIVTSTDALELIKGYTIIETPQGLSDHHVVALVIA